jgi:argininosuccinate synthase
MDPAVAAYGEGSRAWTGAEAACYAKIFGVPQVLALRARQQAASV